MSESPRDIPRGVRRLLGHLSDRASSGSGEAADERLRAARANDAEENAASMPPEDEALEMHCLWLTECYGPSHIGAPRNRAAGLG